MAVTYDHPISINTSIHPTRRRDGPVFQPSEVRLILVRLFVAVAEFELGQRLEDVAEVASSASSSIQMLILKDRRKKKIKTL